MRDFDIPVGKMTVRAAREDIELCLAEMSAEIIKSIDAIEGLDDAGRDEVWQRVEGATQRALDKFDAGAAKLLRPKES